jgi:CRP/FNR family transcriptional regulator
MVLSSLEMQALDSISSTHIVPAGTTLARQGDLRRYVYSVTAGALRMVRLLPDGRRQVTGFALPGDFIGLSMAQQHRHDIEALADTSVCRINLEGMKELCLRLPQLQRVLYERACEELDEIREHMVLLARMNPTERLADFLLRLAAQQARCGNSGNILTLQMPRADIADHLGMTVETVSRSLSTLRSRKLIALPETYRVVILDFDGLEELSISNHIRWPEGFNPHK